MSCSDPPTCSKSQNVIGFTTPEPHYIPGYGGYVPQEKYRYGNTYGVTSHRVLIDPCIHLSCRTILTSTNPDHCSNEFGRPGLSCEPFAHSQQALVDTRVNSFGRQQYTPNMRSGYTGFIPRFQTILGHTYSPACNRALARFEQEQWRDRLFNKELEALDGWRFCYKSKPWELPEVNRADDCDLQEFARPPPCDQPPCFGQAVCGQQNKFPSAIGGVASAPSGCGCR